MNDPATSCKEYLSAIPCTSDHIWNADRHGIPLGPCLTCGVEFTDYQDRVSTAAKLILYSGSYSTSIPDPHEDL